MKMLLISAVALVAANSQVSFAQTLTPDQPAQRSIERRAVEAVNWGMSAVNYDLMLQEMLTKTSGRVNQIIYWSRPLDWHNQTLTPNPDAIYFMVFFDTRDAGPIVFDIPPGDDNARLSLVNTVAVISMPESRSISAVSRCISCRRASPAGVTGLGRRRPAGGSGFSSNALRWAAIACCSSRSNSSICPGPLIECAFRDYPL